VPSPITETEWEAAIVILGDFNPPIFQPLWFSANGLMPAEETKNADIAVINKKVVSFSMGKMQVFVSEERLTLATVESPQGPLLRDLAIGTLSVLEHTPLKAIGINLDTVFIIESNEAWHAIGHRLVPKSHWTPVISQPGMQQVIVEGKREGCLADKVQIRVQPTAQRHVMVAINQHYQLATKDRTDVRERHNAALRALRDDWTSFFKYASEAATKVIAPDADAEQAKV
jgi:hypothetical protein